MQYTAIFTTKKHFGVEVVQRKVYIKFLLLALPEIGKVYSHHQFIVDPSITVAAARMASGGSNALTIQQYAMKAFSLITMGPIWLQSNRNRTVE